MHECDVNLHMYTRSILASGSADCTVAIWDLSQGKCVVIIPHPDKVLQYNNV